MVLRNFSSLSQSIMCEVETYLKTGASLNPGKKNVFTLEVSWAWYDFKLGRNWSRGRRHF